PIVDELGAAAKDEFNKASKESYLDADFDTKIEDESSKIDLNDLVSPSKVLRENTRKQILNMFKSRIESDEAFQERYGNVRFEELVNNIADWMSGQRESLNGGDKKNAYKEYDTESLPPSRAFRTLSELHLVAGMDDELYNMLEPRVTIYGLRGVNPNTASKDVIMSLDEGITSEIADAAIKRRDTPEEGGPFKTSKAGEPSDFEAFLRQKGARLSDTFKDIPFVYDSIVAFRVSAIGSFAKSSRKITVITFDLEESASRLTSQLKTEAPPSSTTTTTTIPGASQGQGTGSTAKKNTKGPPRIVYWTEE
ncbi:MAG: type II secretion system protein GspK, partial [Bdellovibrionota bacterium]